MKSKKISWSSPSLGKKTTIDVYGEGGTSVILLDPNPESEDNKDRETLLLGIEKQIEMGFNRVYCPPKEEQALLLNTEVDPHCRLASHIRFESFIKDELIPRIRKDSKNTYLILAGAGWGSFLALNMMLKYPECFDKLISMAGPVNIRHLFGDYFADDLYYNNPAEYLPKLTDKKFLDLLRESDLRLATLEEDNDREQIEFLSIQLFHKNIDHHLDVWGADKENVPETWGEMLQKHIH